MTIASLSMPALAFLGYGIWAAWINYSTESNQFIVAGATQGVYAFFTTLLLKLLVDFILSQLSGMKEAKLLTWGICLILLASIPTILHWLVGTVEIFAAVLPGIIFGGLYLLFILNYYASSSETKKGKLHHSR